MSDSETKPDDHDGEATTTATATAPANEAQVASVAQQPPEQLKEGGYGWVVVLAAALLNAHTWGLNSSFAVFLAYYLRNNTFEGATTLGFAFVGGVSVGFALLVSPIATILAGHKRFGTRKTIFLGTVFETMGLIFVSSVPVPSQWFNKKRSLANACAAAGSGFGGLTYSLGTNAMIASIGLPWAFRILAILCFVVNSICSYLIRDRNQAVGSVHIALNWQLFKRPPFLLYQGWMIFSMIPYTALVFSIVDYCQSVGLTASQASLVGALLNLAQGLGRPVIGLSSDSVGRLNVAGLCTAFCGIMCVTLWLFSTNLATCIVFAMLAGTVAGVIWATAAPVLAEVIGLQLLPSGLSLSWIILVLPATFAEVIVLEIRQRGYRAAQLFIGFMYLAAFLFMWALRSWKLREMEAAHLNKEEREGALRDDGVFRTASRRQDAMERASIATRTSLAYAKGLWSFERV
ncbi:uncharacterized protein JN550_006224 [Neoarthrinium moseri]|uniref:uncharacterized protein n=1 Tax=Neoarthrinium moseri TaxID=1658444 RepID=UPI001FDE1814|nr:uncharacterized protein JN550_006224 [Neoarthrinium moseri]KAI1868649.1 hypothetical protein JN550_006224 [Neoarthrinium moseri]